MNVLRCALCLPLLIGCQQPGVLDNTSFNLWCGKSLCDWKTERGSVRRVATWDAEDYGVELVGQPTVISQDANLGALPGPCMKFSVLGGVDTRAEVELQLDFFNDGTIDYRESIPGVQWQRLDLLVKLPTQPYSSMKVLLDKQGSGTAIFGGLGAANASRCDGDPIALSNLQPGDWCSSVADCASSHCEVQPGASSGTASMTCAECTKDDDCSNGMLCAIVQSQDRSASFLGCVPPNSATDGSACSSDAQCENGHCQSGVCGECAADDDCGTGRACSKVTSDGSPFHNACVTPGNLPVGAVCSAAGDCAGGHCVNGVCGDCATDADCGDDRTCELHRVFAACVAPGSLPNGIACTVGRECKSNYCCGQCGSQQVVCLGF